MDCWCVSLGSLRVNQVKEKIAGLIAYYFFAGDKVPDSRPCEFRFMIYDDAEQFYNLTSKFIKDIRKPARCPY